MNYYVYLAECSDYSLYCGYTTNLDKRIKAHNEGKSGAKYTRSKRPVKLVYYEETNSLKKALIREYQIKKLSHTEKVDLIKK